MYDDDKSGELSYKEFVGGLFNNSSIASDKKATAKKNGETVPKTMQEYLEIDE